MSHINKCECQFCVDRETLSPCTFDDPCMKDECVGCSELLEQAAEQAFDISCALGRQ